MKLFSSLANPEYETTPFVDFHLVNPGTDLQELNLNWKERDLPEKTRTKHVHRLHPYLGKYIPQLVEIFLRKFKPSTVYDPFCGSGTTLVEANTLGIESIGCDISSFNCLVTRAKVAAYDPELLEKEVKARIRELNEAISPNLFSEVRTVENSSEYLRSWFHPNALNALILYRNLIEGSRYHELLQVILSRSARSARLTTHHHLDFPKKPQTEPYQCRKHDRICQPTSDALQFLRRYSLDTIARVREFARIRTKSRITIHWDDSRTVKLKKLDMIMTSPPYVGLIDYHEQHRYAYELLGLPSRETEEIGAAAKGKSIKAHTEYLAGIKQTLANARSYMTRGGVAVIVVGDREGLYTDDLARELDFAPICRLRRHVNRRTGRRNGEFFEDVLVWEAA